MQTVSLGQYRLIMYYKGQMPVTDDLVLLKSLQQICNLEQSKIRCLFSDCSCRCSLKRGIWAGSDISFFRWFLYSSLAENSLLVTSAFLKLMKIQNYKLQYTIHMRMALSM